MKLSTARPLLLGIVLLWPLMSAPLVCAESVSPSTRTRTFAKSETDYYEQITKGHPYRFFDRDMAIRVMIKPGEGVAHFKPEMELSLRKAFEEWASFSNSKIRFEFVNESPAGIVCQFVESIPHQKPGVAGHTSYSYSPHHIDSALISIKTTSTVTLMTDELLHAVCLHEIGHALGLVDHSLDPHDVMYPYLSAQKNLSQRDINTIRLLYNFKPPESILNLAQTAANNNFDHHIVLFDSSGTEYGEYVDSIIAKLRKNFLPFSTGPWLEAHLRFFVDSAGNVSNYKIFESSTNDEFDEKVLSTLLSSLPLPPAPEKLLKNKWTKVPVAAKFRSDGWIISYVHPDPNQSDWTNISEEPTPEETLKELSNRKDATPKLIDPTLEPWIIEVTRKAQDEWKIKGNGKTEIALGIGSDGRVTHLVVAQSSGDASFDRSVIDACMAAEPYPASPKPSQETTELNILFER